MTCSLSFRVSVGSESWANCKMTKVEGSQSTRSFRNRDGEVNRQSCRKTDSSQKKLIERIIRWGAVGRGVSTVSDR